MPELGQSAKKFQLLRPVFDNIHKTIAPGHHPTKAQKKDLIQGIQHFRLLARVFQCRDKGLK